jgi:hypothetical protein
MNVSRALLGVELEEDIPEGTSDYLEMLMVRAHAGVY